MPEIHSYTSLESLCFSAETPLLEMLKKQDEAVKSGLPAGIALIVDAEGILIGTITNGDLRRAAVKYGSYDLTVGEVMQKDPIFFPADYSYKDIIKALPDKLQTKGRKSSRFLEKVVMVDEAQKPVRIIEYHQLWEQRVASHRHVVVVGLGYVGFTLSVALADKGFRVTGVDVDPGKIESLKNGESYIHEQGILELFREQLGQYFFPSTELPEEGDVYIISVGTPVPKMLNGVSPSPDLGALQLSAQMVGEKLGRGNLVILRSTVPIGTTRKYVLPVLEKASGLKVGEDFHLAFAPERTAEGKAVKELRELPQIIGGFNEESVEATAALFRDLTPTIVRVKNLEEAEMAKLINNCYRDLIFAFSNQLSMIANQFNIDVVDTIKAANQGYPRDPVPLPSPGVGGPCLTKDPYIFSSVARQMGIESTLFEQGREINQAMLGFVAERVVNQLKRIGKNPQESTVLVCGLAFKGHPETGDIRNSTSVEIAKLIEPQVGRLIGHDPVSTDEEIEAEGITPVDFEAGLKIADAVLFLNNHRSYEKIDVFDMVRKLKAPGIVFDGWKLFDPSDILNACPCVYMNLSQTLSSIEEKAIQVK